MPLRTLLIVALPFSAIAVLYTATVQRGPMGMREELAWETALYGELPMGTRIFAEQRMPEFPGTLRWLAPVFADVHAVDVRLRRAYWHEEVVPDFDDPPEFAVTK